MERNPSHYVGLFVFFKFCFNKPLIVKLIPVNEARYEWRVMIGASLVLCFGIKTFELFEGFINEFVLSALKNCVREAMGRAISVTLDKNW